MASSSLAHGLPGTQTSAAAVCGLSSWLSGSTTGTGSMNVTHGLVAPWHVQDLPGQEPNSVP